MASFHCFAEKLCHVEMMQRRQITWSVAFATCGYSTRRLAHMTLDTHRIFSIKSVGGPHDDTAFWPPPKGTKQRRKGRKKGKRRAPVSTDLVEPGCDDKGEVGDDEAEDDAPVCDSGESSEHSGCTSAHKSDVDMDGDNGDGRGCTSDDQSSPYEGPGKFEGESAFESDVEVPDDGKGFSTPGDATPNVDDGRDTSSSEAGLPGASGVGGSDVATVPGSGASAHAVDAVVGAVAPDLGGIALPDALALGHALATYPLGPAPRIAVDTVEVSARGGYIRYNPRTDNFVAACKQEGHSTKCISCEKRRSRLVIVEGVALPRQPLGELLAWLQKPHKEKFSHGEYAPPYAIRSSARDRCKADRPEEYERLLQIERCDLPEDRPDEP